MKSKSLYIQWLIIFGIGFAASLLMLQGCAEKESVSIARMTILISGNARGYLRNCGCSTGQWGGEVRKARLIKESREEAYRITPADRQRPVDVLTLELGNFTDPKTPDLKIESQGIVESLALLDYDSVGIGANELRYTQDELAQLFAGCNLPLTAANLRFIKPGKGEDHSAELNAMFAPFRIVAHDSGYRTGIIHIIDEATARDAWQDNGIELTDAAAAIKDILTRNIDDADWWLLTMSDPDAAGTNANDIAAITDLVMAIGLDIKNPLAAKDAVDTTYPLFFKRPFDKSKDILKIEVLFDDEGAIRSLKDDRVRIGPQIKYDEQVVEIVNALQPKLEELEVAHAQEMMRDRGPHPWYVGHGECAMCHADIVDQLEDSAHAHAYESLKEKGQHKSASCVKCHVVGHGTGSGWNVIENQGELRNVHCENCHGPGEYHVLAMTGDVPEGLSADGRNAMGLLPITAEPASCITCHDPQNSKDFNFDTYWPQIEH